MKIQQALTLFMLAALISSTASALDSVDVKVNAIYDRMSAAYVGFNEKQMEHVYAQDGAYMPGNTLLKGRKSIAASFIPMFENLKENNAKLNIEFRVIDRKYSKDMVTDVGYYKLTITPPKELTKSTPLNGLEGEPRQSFGKFIITAIPGEEDDWAFYNDLSTGSTQTAYVEAKPITGWKYAL